MATMLSLPQPKNHVFHPVQEYTIQWSFYICGIYYTLIIMSIMYAQTRMEQTITKHSSNCLQQCGNWCNYFKQISRCS